MFQEGWKDMNVLTGSSFGMLERSVDFLWTKQTAILDNIANVETPNYKVKTVTFEEAFEQKLLAAQRSENPRQAVRDVIENASWEVMEDDESVHRNDNGVNITEQSVELIRTAYQLSQVYRSITGNLSIMRAAMNG